MSWEIWEFYGDENYMLVIDILKIFTKRYQCPWGSLLRDGCPKYSPDALLPKTMVNNVLFHC